jgi:hypothetical protein
MTEELLELELDRELLNLPEPDRIIRNKDATTPINEKTIWCIVRSPRKKSSAILAMKDIKMTSSSCALRSSDRWTMAPSNNPPNSVDSPGEGSIFLRMTFEHIEIPDQSMESIIQRA